MKCGLSPTYFLQVLQLLDVLGMGQYKAMFDKEKITGSLLLDLDESILEQELGMVSKIHRLKIMRLLDGRQALADI